MDIIELFNKIMNKKEEVGEKLVDLEASEIAMFEKIQYQKEQLEERLKSFELDSDNLKVQSRLWWREIETKYKINGRLTIRDGKVHRLIEKGD